MNISIAIVQLSLVALWALVLFVHLRRLIRLAAVRPVQPLRTGYVRQQAQRLWWWLGREEFWRAVQMDAFHCVQVSLMLVLLMWGS